MTLVERPVDPPHILFSTLVIGKWETNQLMLQEYILVLIVTKLLSGIWSAYCVISITLKWEWSSFTQKLLQLMKKFEDMENTFRLLARSTWRSISMVIEWPL